MHGVDEFCEVYFDDVRLAPDALIGEENKGWDAAVVMLRNERVNIGTMVASQHNPLGFDLLRESIARLLPGLDCAWAGKGGRGNGMFNRRRTISRL